MLFFLENLEKVSIQSRKNWRKLHFSQKKFQGGNFSIYFLASFRTKSTNLGSANKKWWTQAYNWNVGKNSIGKSDGIFYADSGNDKKRSHQFWFLRKINFHLWINSPIFHNFYYKNRLFGANEESIFEIFSSEVRKYCFDFWS